MAGKVVEFRPKRMGRTIEMLEAAVQHARAGSDVYLVGFAAQHRDWRRYLMRELGPALERQRVRYVVPGTLARGLLGVGDRAEVWIDHYVWESRALSGSDIKELLQYRRVREILEGPVNGAVAEVWAATEPGDVAVPSAPGQRDRQARD